MFPLLFSEKNQKETENREKSLFFSSQVTMLYGKIVTIRNGGES